MKPIITKWPDGGISGAKRANLTASDWIPDWFVGYGKDESCQFEGTWWDMICFARNVLSSENTKMAAPEYYLPSLAISHYTGDEPYEFKEEAEHEEKG